MAMKRFGVLEGVFGWGVLIVTMALFSGFSTVLNGLVTLNGLFCFDTVRGEAGLEESAVSSFSAAGYIHNHYYILNTTCADVDAALRAEPYPFCQKWSTIGPNGALSSQGIICNQSISVGRRYMRRYRHNLRVNCTASRIENHTFQLTLTPGSSSMTGMVGEFTGYLTTAVVQADSCRLSQQFYIIFASLCIALAATVLTIRALMRTCLVNLSFRLSNSLNLYGVYKALQKYGFFSFYNPYMNEPYHLVKGEKIYVLRKNNLNSSESNGMVHDVESGAAGRFTSRPEFSTDMIRGFAWSSFNAAYKFTYDGNGNVYAYSKDFAGFEAFVEGNVQASVAATILGYLKLKSEGACITTEERSHFLSLTECSVLAKQGYQWVEEISDDNYRMYGRTHVVGENTVGEKPGEKQSLYYKPT